MGMPREMVSDVLYAMIVGFAGGDDALVEGLLALYEIRYASGVLGEAMFSVGYTEAARASGVAKVTLFDRDKKLRAIVTRAVEAGWFRRADFVREAA